MEEKRKRVRPTVAQVKALEAELAEIRERLTHALSVRNDTIPKRAYDEVWNLKMTLEQSNDLMSAELNNLRVSYVELKNDYKELKEENKRLRTRTLWQRIRNK